MTSAPWAQKIDTNSQETREVLQAVGLGHLRTNQLARDLGPGQRQMLSLSRAEVTPHKIMILDETTASTSEEHFNDILELVAAGRRSPVPASSSCRTGSTKFSLCAIGSRCCATAS